MESKVSKTALDTIEALVVGKGSLGPLGEGTNWLQVLREKRFYNSTNCYGR